MAGNAYLPASSLASGANMWKLARGYGAQPMEEEAEGRSRESIRNRSELGSRKGEEEVEKGKKKKNWKEKRQKAVCLPGRHLGAVS